RVGRWLTLHKPWLEVLVTPIYVDALKEDAMEMEVQIHGTTETLDKRHRPRLHVGSLQASGDCLVHIILPDRGADAGMDLRRPLLGRGHPIPQGDWHRDDPLAGGDPGNDLLDEVGGGLGHAPPSAGGTKP